MRNLVNSSIFKRVLLIILFIIASYYTYSGTYTLYPIVTYYGRGALTILPVALTLGLFLFSEIILYFVFSVKNVRNKWKAIHVYTVTTLFISVISLLLNVLFISSVEGYTSIVMTLFFPWDILTIQCLFLVISVLCLVWLIKNRSLREVEPTFIGGRKRDYARYISLSCFAHYFFGLFMNRLSILELDHNFFGCFAIVLILLLPVLGLIFYSLYYVSDNESKKRKYKTFMIVYLSVAFVLYLWLDITLFINKRLIAESASNLFPLGYAAKIPAGLLIIFLLTYIPLFVAFIKYLKQNKKHE